MKCGIAALNLFPKIIMIEYLTSIFVIPCLQSAGGGFDIRYLSAFGGFAFPSLLSPDVYISFNLLPSTLYLLPPNRLYPDT
jgi:hypothetical protein